MDYRTPLSPLSAPLPIATAVTGLDPPAAGGPRPAVGFGSRPPPTFIPPPPSLSRPHLASDEAIRASWLRLLRIRREGRTGEAAKADDGQNPKPQRPSTAGRRCGQSSREHGPSREEKTTTRRTSKNTDTQVAQLTLPFVMRPKSLLIRFNDIKSRERREFELFKPKAAHNVSNESDTTLGNLAPVIGGNNAYSMQTMVFKENPLLLTVFDRIQHLATQTVYRLFSFGFVASQILISSRCEMPFKRTKLPTIWLDRIINP